MKLCFANSFMAERFKASATIEPQKRHTKHFATQ